MRNRIYFWGLLSLVVLILCYQNVDAENSNSRNKDSVLEKYTNEKLKQDAESNPDKSWANGILWESIEKNRSDTLHSVKSHPNIIERSTSHASFSARVNKDVAAFNFKLVGLFDKYDSFDHFNPSYIEIRNASDGRFMQKITIADKVEKKYREYIGYGYPDIGRADMVQLVDLNFDGYLDLRILQNVGATGCNSYVSFLYDPKLKKFVFNKKLSHMLILKVDTKKQQIITYDRSGYCQEYMRYYKVKNNKFVVTKVEWSETWNVNAPCFKFTGIPLREGIVTGNEKCPYMDRKGELLKKLKDITKEEFQGSLDGRRRGMYGIPH